MTENEAIQVAKRAAQSRRWEIQFRPITAFLVDDHSPLLTLPHGREYVGKWVVPAGSSYVGPIDILIDDQSGRVTWINGPPPLWIQRFWIVVTWMISPIFWPFVAFYSIERAWHHFRLPRCPRCRSKLRTRIAQQCPKCRYDWHDLPGKSTIR